MGFPFSDTMNSMTTAPRRAALLSLRGKLADVIRVGRGPRLVMRVVIV